MLLLAFDPREEGWRDGSGDGHDCGMTAAGESEILITTGLAPFASVRAPALTVTRAGPGSEGEPFRRDPGLVGRSGLESRQPGGNLVEGIFGERLLDKGEHLSLFQADVRL